MLLIIILTIQFVGKLTFGVMRKLNKVMILFFYYVKIYQLPFFI